MDKFNVLPTDPRFQELTIPQLDYIMSSMIKDNEEANALMSGANKTESDSDFQWDEGSDLELPTAEEEALINEQLHESIDEKQRLLDYKYENGIPLTDKDIQLSEALKERVKIHERIDETLEVLDRTGMSLEEYKVYGDPVEPVKTNPQDNKSMLDAINDFNKTTNNNDVQDDDDFVDLT